MGQESPTPAAIRRWFEIVDECTDETGLVTSEIVPAFRARGPGIDTGGLRVAGGGDRHGQAQRPG